MPAPLARVTALYNRLWYHTRPGRIINRFNDRQASLLANGMAYNSLFAFFAALWTAFGFFGIVFTGNEHLRDTLIKMLSLSVPGLIATPEQPGVITESTLTTASSVLGWTSAISALVFLFTMVSWMSVARSAMRTIADIPQQITNNWFIQKLRDSIMLLVVVIIVIVSAIATAIFSNIAAWALKSLPEWAHASFQVDATALLISIALDTSLIAVMVRGVAKFPVRSGRLWLPSFAGGVAISLMKLAGSSLLGAASKNPFLVSFTAIIGIIIWFNLMNLVLLWIATWTWQTDQDKSATPPLGFWN